MKAIKNFCALCAICMALVACEKPILDATSSDSNEPLGNVTLTFSAHGATTRAASTTLASSFSKLNVMLFNADGTKYFDKVRTQYSTDENFGQLSLTLPAGEYGVVAVGHSSAKSATIKSMEMVQFTATDGQKLTDTFCYGGTVTVGEAPEQHQLTMNRMGAMVRFTFTDEEIPAQLTHVKFDYTGGSANFNPTTSEGTTKSTQSETRPVAADDVYEIFTFPYLSSSCTLKVTVTALTAQGDVIKKRTLEQVPVTRNRITSYTGPLFSEGEGTITQSGFSFTVNGEWEGEDSHEF
jgi:hypothetical protein